MSGFDSIEYELADGRARIIICADDALFGFPPARDLGALPNMASVA